MQTSACFSLAKILTLLTSAFPWFGRRWLFCSLLTLSCFGLSPRGHALLPPPAPDGGYPEKNTAEGQNALQSLTTGTDNTALGFQALSANENGSFNTATGSFALYNCSPGHQNNTATGYLALANTSGSFNTANGAAALSSNQSGGVNVANGYKAMEANLSGFYNVACGGFALGTNTAGSYNVATGANALYYNKASNNTAVGHQALQNNTTGGNNIAIGFQAGNNITTGSNNIDIGALGNAGESNTIRIGRSGVHKIAYMQGVYGGTVASASGVPVYVDSGGHLGTIKSSERYKDAIQPMDKASEAILQLEPVTFRYKEELDPDGVRQFGLIAEQVEKVDPELVVRDSDGKVSTVRYEAVNAMLLNEFLKEHRTVRDLKDTVVKQQAMMAKQEAQIEALADAVQRVSTPRPAKKRPPQLVANQR